MTEKQKEAFEKLGFSPEEMEEVLATDKEIDRGAKLFELPEELKAGAKKARQADRKKTGTSNRERKVNADKLEIMETISKALACLTDDVGEIVNERELVFHFNKVKYKLTLSCPRK